MSSHAKATSAGSNRRQATGLGRILPGAGATRGSSRASKGSGAPKARLAVLAASVLALVLALTVGSASALQTHNFKEVFGSSEQPTFATDTSIAVDQGSGDVLVLETSSSIDEIRRYNSDGTPSNFGALSSNVIDGEGGADETPLGNLSLSNNRQREQIAIDDSGEATDGNIYVTESVRDVVNIFSSTGAYLGQLSESSGSGAFGEPCGVAVDENGLIYVGDRGDDRIHVFDPAANPPVNGDNTASFATVTDPCTLSAGAGATAGFLFVNASTGAQLRKVDAATGEVKYQIATGGSTVTVNPADGHVFAARNTSGSSTVDEYDASGAAEGELELLSTIKPGSTAEGVAVNESSGEIYVSGAFGSNVNVYEGAIVTQPEVATEAASELTGVNATLNGSVNPDGVELSECFFEWGEGLEFDQTAPCAETPAEIGSGESPVAVHADITDLQPNGTQYRFRLVAVNPESEATGTNVLFTTPDTVFTEAASGVSDDEATLNGSIDPDEEPTECEFEWGLTDEYGETAPCAEGPAEIGTGTSPVAVHADISCLATGTVYHFRLVATNANGPIAADDETLQTLGPVLGRTWVEDVIYKEAKLKAEIDPEGVETTYHFEYGTSEAYGSETPEKVAGSDSSVHEVTAPIAGLTPGTDYHFRVVATSADGVNVGPDRVLTTYEPLSPDTTCANQDFRTGSGGNLADCRAYELVSSPEKEGALIKVTGQGGCAGCHTPIAAVGGEAAAYQAFGAFDEGEPSGSAAWSDYLARRGPDGWRSEQTSPPHDTVFGLNFIPLKGYTPDLGSLAGFGPWITPSVPESSTYSQNMMHRDNASGVWRQVSLNLPAGLDESTGLQYVAISADGSHVVFESKTHGLTGEGPGIFDWDKATGELTKLPIASVDLTGPANFRHAVSADGSRVFTGAGVVIDGATLQSVAVSNFRYASSDGSTAFYGPAGGDLHRYDVEADELVQLTEGAELLFATPGGAEDGSRLYFIGEGALAAGAVPGERNLYLWSDDGTAKGEITHVATGGVPASTCCGPNDGSHTLADGGSVSQDGRYFVFNEKLSGVPGHPEYPATGLTGYANEGNPELYLYDAVADKLACVSCNPSNEPGSSGAAMEPGSESRSSIALQQHDRYVSDDGRVFFDTEEALLPWDVNGNSDAYEYASSTGELALLSSGTSSRDSLFAGVGANGRDAFFSTSESLVGIDNDGLYDVYDARAGGGLAAQNPPDPASPCAGDACQSPLPAPDIRTPSSASFRGAGDPVARRSCGAQAKRAARLSRRAKRARRAAGRSASKRRSVRLRRRSMRLAKNAKRQSTSAKRCRRANRRAGK